MEAIQTIVAILVFLGIVVLLILILRRDAKHVVIALDSLTCEESEGYSRASVKIFSKNDLAPILKTKKVFPTHMRRAFQNAHTITLVIKPGSKHLTDILKICRMLVFFKEQTPDVNFYVVAPNNTSKEVGYVLFNLNAKFIPEKCVRRKKLNKETSYLFK